MRIVCVLLLSAVAASCAGDGTGLDQNGDPVATIMVSPEDPAVPAGVTVQLSATRTNSSGNTVPATSVTWSSNNPSVATVNSSGVVTGVSAGTARITATSGSESGGTDITVVASAAFAADVQTIFNQSCAFANGCHAGTQPQQGQDLSQGNAYAAIVNVPSMELPSMPRVDPGVPLNSYLVHKIRGTHLEVGGSGVRMPFGGQLPQNEIDIIRAWVQAGAPNN